MPELSDFKYVIAFLAILVVLIWILQTSDSDIITTEGFNLNNIPDESTMRLLAESASRDMINNTKSNVIDPCIKSNPNNRDAIIQCVKNYKRYYEDVIKFPASDLYGRLTQLDGSDLSQYSDVTAKIDSKEEYLFMVAVSNAYSQALSRWINNEININTELPKMILNIIKKAYTGNIADVTKPTTKPMTQVESAVRQTISNAVQTEMTQKPKEIRLTCKEINQGLNVYVDGVKLQCK